MSKWVRSTFRRGLFSSWTSVPVSHSCRVVGGISLSTGKGTRRKDRGTPSLAWRGHRGQTVALLCPPFSRRHLWCSWVALIQINKWIIKQRKQHSGDPLPSRLTQLFSFTCSFPNKSQPRFNTLKAEHIVTERSYDRNYRIFLSLATFAFMSNLTEVPGTTVISLQKDAFWNCKSALRVFLFAKTSTYDQVLHWIISSWNTLTFHWFNCIETPALLLRKGKGAFPHGHLWQEARTFRGHELKTPGSNSMIFLFSAPRHTCTTVAVFIPPQLTT